MAGRPKVGGLPYLVETLRCAGVKRNHWFLSACQSLYLSGEGPIAALRTDQAGKSTYPEFLLACWHAGVVRYDVDFTARTCTYFGCDGEKFIEDYPEAAID